MQLIKQTITLPTPFQVSEEQEEFRNALALRGASIVAITTNDHQEAARVVAVEIRKHVKDVEATRVQLTKPLLEGQRLLKALADDYVAPLTGELSRIERLATNYQEAEQRRVAAAEEARRLAFEKAERERIAAEEAARKAAEKATTEKGLEKAINKEAVAIAAAEKVNAIVAAPLPEAQKAKGQTMRRMLRWEVTDIRALVTARPDLCNIEPKASAIQAVCVPEMPNLPPGLKLWWENKASFTTR